MSINRMIVIGFIIGTVILTSFYGGNVSYALFYLSFLIPFVSFLYTVYVYARFRLYQDIGRRIVVKGELIPYSFTIANEDFVTFSSIKVNFLWDKSAITNGKSVKEYCLLPGEKISMETTMVCNYRGEYYIGVNSVDITDFFYLFRITYPIQSKLKVTVLPRIIPLKNLSLLPNGKDLKEISPYTVSDQERIDIETRPYKKGDSKKLIHWKVSAKKNELYTRKLVSDPKIDVTVIIDTTAVEGKEMKQVMVEDSILEAVLAITNFCKENRTKVTVFYEKNGVSRIPVYNNADFPVFYNLCKDMAFRGNISLDELIKTVHSRDMNHDFYIIITHFISNETYLTLLKLQEKGIMMAILFITYEEAEDDTYIRGLRDSYVTVKIITKEDNIGEVLSL